MTSAKCVTRPRPGPMANCSCVAKRGILSALVALATLLCAARVCALINPHFTPVHLVRQSALIVCVDLKPGASPDLYSATIRQVLKGQTALKALRLDLSKAINTQNANALRQLAAPGKAGLFFVGEFGEDKDGQGGGPAKTRGLLHLSGQWAEFDSAQEGEWTLNQIDPRNQGIWAGGTDMLQRAVDYILQDDDPDVPVAAGVAWGTDQRKIATLSGNIRAVRPIDLAGDGKWLVFVACDQGDHLLACDPKSRDFADLTAARRLQSKSRAFAWGDFDGQGRLDLISFDGTTLSLHAQQADGTFQAGPLPLAGALDNGCLGLAALDCGSKEKSGLLVSTKSWPVLVSFGADGKALLSRLTATGLDLNSFGQAGVCLLADFDGDGIADVLAPFATGSVLFRGLAPGEFAPGITCKVQLGTGPRAPAWGISMATADSMSCP